MHLRAAVFVAVAFLVFAVAPTQSAGQEPARPDTSPRIFVNPTVWYSFLDFDDGFKLDILTPMTGLRLGVVTGNWIMSAQAAFGKWGDRVKFSTGVNDTERQTVDRTDLDIILGYRLTAGDFGLTPFGGYKAIILKREFRINPTSNFVFTGTNSKQITIDEVTNAAQVGATFDYRIRSLTPYLTFAGFFGQRDVDSEQGADFSGIGVTRGVAGEVGLRFQLTPNSFVSIGYKAQWMGFEVLEGAIARAARFDQLQGVTIGFQIIF